MDKEKTDSGGIPKSAIVYLILFLVTPRYGVHFNRIDLCTFFFIEEEKFKTWYNKVITLTGRNDEWITKKPKYGGQI